MRYVFIHGLGQNSSSWDKVISFLPESSQFSCPDLWALLNDGEHTYANLYRAFKDYCNAVSGPVNLCGLSLGAMLALHYAMEHGEKVQSLVLVGAQYKMPKGLLKFQNIIFRFMPGAAFAKMGIQKDDVIKLTGSMLDLDYTVKLKNVSCPTLIVCGENDSANKKAAMALTEKIHGAELHLVKNAGHEVNVDAPAKLAAALAAFWEMVK